MNRTSRGMVLGGFALTSVLILGLIGLAPAMATPSAVTTQNTSCTANTPYEEWQYTKTYPAVDEVKHQEWRFQTRTKTYGEVEHKYVKSTYDFVDGGQTNVNGQVVSGHWVGGLPLAWRAIDDSVINAVWGPGGIPGNLIGGSEANPKGNVPLSAYGGPNISVPYYAATEEELTGYTAYGPFSAWSTTNPGPDTEEMNVETRWVFDVIGVPAHTVWYGVGGAEVNTAAEAIWIPTDPGGDWVEYDHRTGSTTTNVPCAPSGTVTFKDTRCDAANPFANIVTVATQNGTTKEAFLWNGTVYVSIGTIPEGDSGDSLIDDFGFPAKIKVVLTGEDGNSLPPFEHTFLTASKDAAACEIITPVVTIEYRGLCVYNAAQDISTREAWLKYDNSGSNIPVDFTVPAPNASLSRTVPAGDVVEVQVPDSNGASFQVTAGGQVFDVTLPTFDGCKPIDPKLAPVPGDCFAIGGTDYNALTAGFTIVNVVPALGTPGLHTFTVEPKPGNILTGGVPSIDLVVDIPDKQQTGCGLANTGYPVGPLLVLAWLLLFVAMLLFLHKNAQESEPLKIGEVK